MVCTVCDRPIALPTCVIHASSLTAGLWQLLCDCGHRFTVDELLRCGGTLQSGSEAVRAMHTN